MRVLFDTGSHKSFITAKAAASLGLEPMKKESLSIRAFGSSETDNKMRDVVQFYVTFLQEGERITIECVVVDEITDIVNEHTDLIKKQYPYLHNLWFSDYFNRNEKSLTIQVLIGSDYLCCFQDGETIRRGPHEPVAVRTKLGWVLSGPLRGKKFSDSINVNYVSALSKNEKLELDSAVNKLWDLDNLGIRPENEVHESMVDDILFTGEQYSAEKVYYMPHRAVIREDSETTKVRIVYDASCKDKKSGTSLNDCLHVGPPLTPLIY